MASSSNKRPAGYDYEKCFVCQSDKKDPRTHYRQNKTVIEVTDIESVKSQHELWKSKAECPGYVVEAIALLDDVFHGDENPVLLWHRDPCRSNFMSKHKLDRCLDKPNPNRTDISDTMENVSPDNTTRPFLRSQASTYIKDIHCIICCSGVGNGELWPASTFRTHEKIQNIAMSDFELLARLESARDAIAGDVLYHTVCLRNRTRVSTDSKNESDNNRSSHDIVFRQLKREIQWRITRGQAVLVSECWVRFKDLCEEYSLSVPYYLESR